MKIDLNHLSPCHWQLCGSKFRDIRTRWLCKIWRISNPMFDDNNQFLYEIRVAYKKRDDRTSRCLFCEEFCKVIFFWCHEISKRRVANGKESNRLNLSRIKGNRGTRFEALLYYHTWFSIIFSIKRMWSSISTKLTTFRAASIHNQYYCITVHDQH